MASTFTGISISTMGLYASQTSLYTTNNNISNANTEGYSRQVVNQTSSGSLPLNNGSGMIGNGPEVVSVTRVRDEFLDTKYWDERSSLGEWEIKSSTLLEIEGIFGEPSDFGINEVMNKFYAALEEASKDPTSSAARAVVLQTGTAVCDYLNNIAQELMNLQQEINSTVDIMVGEVNSLTEQIADLNEQISFLEMNGGSANELRDQRTLRVDELSKIVEIQTKEIKVDTLPNGEPEYKFQITLNGNYLVNDDSSNELETYKIDETGYLGICFANTGVSVEPAGGELKAYLDMRDGTGEDGEYKGIPYCIEQLDEFAQTFAMAFNEGIYGDGNQYYEGHAGGYGLDGSTDIRFLTYDNLSSEDFMDSGSDVNSIYSNISALNISISSDVQNDVNMIAVSSELDQEGNNNNINDLIEICQDPKVFNSGNTEDFINSILITLGTESQSASNKVKGQESIVNQIENQRHSVSSVSIDEEMTNMVMYQQSYTMAAKMISMWDEIYQVTIEELG